VPASPPNFALRRATVVLAALLVVGGGLGFLLSLGDDESPDSDTAGTGVEATAAWDVVVLDDPVADIVTVHDADGAEVARVATQLQGVLDVGLPGSVVLGAAGDPAADGLGVLDLTTATITPIDVSLPVVERLGTSSYLLASDQSTGAVQVVDVARGRVIDLTSLAGDGAVVVPDTVRVTDDASRLAFSELRNGQTVVVDLTGTDDPSATVVLPGLLADITDTRVATTTNRGPTMLVDLYDAAGTRLGTTETVPLVGVMVVGDTTMVGVGTDASLLRIDATAATADARDDLQQRLGELIGEGADPVAARNAQVVLEHRRLAVVGAGWSAFIDTDGAVVSISMLDIESTSIDAAATTQRCVLVYGSPTEPSTLFDATDGAVIATFDPSVPIGASVDGCTIARQGFGTLPGSWRGYRVVGPDLDVAPSDRVIALAPDGAAALVSGGGMSLLRFDTDTSVPLTSGTALGTFARLKS
jgi:hypothetical protein